jgi:hypothetical protein
VQPVQVDVVRLQAAQRVLTGVDDGLAARAATVRIAGIQVAAELGRDDEPVAPGAVASQVVADDFFGMTFGVEICGIDKIATELDEAVDDLLRLLDAGASAEVFTEGHGAETERAHAQP